MMAETGYYLGHKWIANGSKLSFIINSYCVNEISQYDVNDKPWNYCFKPISGIEVEFISGALTIPPFILYGCNNIKSAIIPDTVETIEESAFEGCSALKSITFSNELTTIEKNAFKNCSSLIKIALPQHLEKIGKSAFENCANLTYFDIPDTVTKIGKRAFANCSSISGEIKVPRKLKKISSNTFDCCNISRFIVVNNDQFHNDENGILYDLRTNELISVPKTISGVVVIPDNICLIPDKAFKNCEKLTSITLPATIGEIGFETFKGCKNLKRVSSKKSIRSVGDSAFNGCESLEKIDFNCELVMIGSYSFYGCSKLNCTIPTLDSMIVGDYSFYNCHMITEIKFSPKTKVIGKCAFSCCTNLKYIELAANIEYIDDQAFNYCHNVNRISIGKNLNHIGINAISSIDCPIIIDKNNRSFIVLNGNLFTKDETRMITNCHQMKTYFPLSLKEIDWYCPEYNCFSNGHPEIEDIRGMKFRWKEGVFEFAKSQEVPWKHGTYSGEWFNGIPEGNGVMKKVDGTIISGFFHLGTPMGICHINYSNGDIYDGEVANGKRCGPGKLKTVSGNVIDGHFINDLPEGDIVIIFADGSSYKGGYSNGEYHGQGVLNTANGDEYTGTWEFGKMTGTGTHKCFNGEYYEGNFDNGMKNGFGKITYPNGDVYEGYFEDDLKSGNGKFIQCGGNTITGTWINNEPVYNIEKSGKFKGISWRYHLNTLVISANEEFINPGFMENYSDEGLRPWDDAIGDDRTHTLFIENGVKFIGSCAFIDNKKLIGNLRIPDSVEFINYYAFYMCNFDGKLILPDNLKSIGDFAFYGCINFKGTIEIPSGLETIGDFSLSQCGGKGFRVENNDRFYSDSKGLLYTHDRRELIVCPHNFEGKLVLDPNTEIIRKGACIWNKNITSVDFPDELYMISRSSFKGCSKIREIVLCSNITTIEESAFEECKALEKIIMGDNIRAIGCEAFSKCPAIREIRFSDNIIDLGNNTFDGIDFYDEMGAKLKYSVFELKGYHFYLINGKMTRTSDKNTPCAHTTSNDERYLAYNGILWNFNGTTLTIIKNVESKECGKIDDFNINSNAPWKKYTIECKHIKICEGITDIGKNSFSYMVNVLDVIIPKTVKIINNSAFQGCVNIEIISLPDNMKYIGFKAFSECYSLKKIDIGSNPEFIANNAFPSNSFTPNRK